MPDPLRRLFSGLDGGPVVLGSDDRRDLAVEWESLATAGLLAETTPATAVECGACDDPHSASVRGVTTAAGFPTRWFHHCPRVGAVQVDPEELRRWAVLVPPLGRVVTGRDAEERVPDLVWRLGPIPVGPSSERVGWLVAGWRGQSGIADRVPELRAANALVFVPCQLPTTTVWGTVPPAVVPLVEVIRVTGTGVELDRPALATYLPPEPAVVTKADTRPRLSLPAGTRWGDLVLVVGDHGVELLVGRDRHAAEYSDLGLADGRNGSPSAAWVTLRLLAREGKLDSGDRTRTKSATLRNNMAKLRDALTHWTGLTDDPFHRVHRLDPYRPHFTIRTAGILKPA